MMHGHVPPSSRPIYQGQYIFLECIYIVFKVFETHIDFQCSLNLFMGQKLAVHPKMFDDNTTIQYVQTFQKQLFHVSVCVRAYIVRPFS